MARRKDDKNKVEAPSLLYMIGGRGREGETLSSVEVLDTTHPIDQEWVLLDPMPEARWGASAASWGGKIYVFGGNNDQGLSSSSSTILNTAAVFDPLHHPQNAWTALPPMSNRRTNACATAVGKRIYVCGGFGGDQSSDFPLDSAERYDPHLHQWETMPSMQSKRFNAASACMGPLLFIFGGSADRSDALKTVERFDARDGKCTWESMPSMSSKRMGAAATIFTEKGNSMPFVFGGHDGIACLDSVESLKPTGRPWLDGGKDGVWQAVPKMSMPRYCLAACVGKQDTKPKVFVFGGHNGCERVNDVECIEEGASEWEPVPKNRKDEGRRMEIRASAAMAALHAPEHGHHGHHAH